MKKIMIGIVITILLNNGLNAQSHNLRLKEPEVGKPCPAFVFDQIDFYSKNKVRLSDFKGKWLVMIFWSKNCGSCISAFPRESAEQIRFKDSAQILLVGGQWEKDERPLYSNYHNKLKLEMPSAFDSNLFKSFNVGQLPFTVIIDPKGIVRVITDAAHPSEISELMAGKSPSFSEASYDHGHESSQTARYIPDLPFLTRGVQGNGGGVDSNFLYRSLLSNWIPGMPIYDPLKMTPDNGRYELLRVSIQALYNVAYLGRISIFNGDSAFHGKFWPKPILEMQDTSLFTYDPINLLTGKNFFCYSLSVPPSKAKTEYMMRTMQSDLKNYFGYDVFIETRKMPYWRLIATDEAKSKLRSKDIGSEKNQGVTIISWAKFSLKNYSFNLFLKIVESFSGVTDSGASVVDETGIQGDIDIDVDWIKNDYNSVRACLQKNGLDLVPGEREIKCIVIRDPKN